MCQSEGTNTHEQFYKPLTGDSERGYFSDFYKFCSFDAITASLPQSPIIRSN